MKEKILILKSEKFFENRKMDKNKCPKMGNPKSPY
jgi:hypothetical protein